MVDILVISHSNDLAKSIIELLSEMKKEDFKLEYCGGIKDGSKIIFGSDPLIISEKIKEIYVKNDILLICDLGSSYMNSEMAISLLPDEILKHTLIHKGPFFESILIGIIHNQEKFSAKELSEAIILDLKNFY